jgi:hypothetical protein
MTLIGSPGIPHQISLTEMIEKKKKVKIYSITLGMKLRPILCNNKNE